MRLLAARWLRVLRRGGWSGQAARLSTVSCRSLLYVPASDERKVQKSTALEADLVCLDLEDGVAASSKQLARANVLRLFPNLKALRPDGYAVRVNAVDSGLVDDDVNMLAALPKEAAPTTVLLPKVESVEQLKHFDSLWTQARLADRPAQLVWYVESPLGLLNMAAVCAAARRLAALQPLAVVFGSDDYCAECGLQRSDDGHELLYARQKVVSVAKAFHLLAVDMVDINFKDLDLLRRNALAAARMGFDGKQLIHPAQIPVANEAFSPSKERLAWARGLVDAFAEHAQRGTGAFSYRGQMIDMPLYRQAQAMLALAKRARPS